MTRLSRISLAVLAVALAVASNSVHSFAAWTVCVAMAIGMALLASFGGPKKVDWDDELDSLPKDDRV